MTKQFCVHLNFRMILWHIVMDLNLQYKQQMGKVVRIYSDY